jgi:uncharacterized protein YmfQ (DUF2313 family)
MKNGMIDRSQRLADAYCRRVAQRLRKEPDLVVAKARSNLKRMAPHCHSTLIERWETLLARPAARMARDITAARNAELRRNHPFAGVVGKAEREKILRAVRREAARA